MSMNAVFIQIEPAQLSKLRADPSRAEELFAAGTPMPNMANLVTLSKSFPDRVRTAGPQHMANALSRLDPRMREELEKRLGRTVSAMAAGDGGDAILKLMQERTARHAASQTKARPTLNLDKAWHGVHYLLCGKTEPGPELLSQAVLGGIEINDDADEGFSGYGPARYFTSEGVANLSQALNRAEFEEEAASRFDPVRMSQLSIYPGWQASDREWVMDSFRRLREFYSDAAAQGRAIVTCLV